MKTTSQKTHDVLSRLKDKKIEQPQSIIGGGGGIKKDKVKKPKNQG